MAEQQLPPGTRQWLNALLADDPELDSVLSSARSIEMARDCTSWTLMLLAFVAACYLPQPSDD
ncbi:MAG: hypothetical protein ACJARY_000317 [Candidatus Azotimanducaceae bacterium]|jgi:hypothetical protein